MFNVYQGTLTSSATLNLGTGGVTSYLLGSIIKVLNTGVGIVTVGASGFDSMGVPWSEPVASLNLALLGVGSTVRGVLPCWSGTGTIVINVGFVGILGTPSLDFTFGVA